MKSARKLSLRREALGELATDELLGVAAGWAPPTLQYGVNGVVSCLISTPTWCGYICNIEIEKDDA